MWLAGDDQSSPAEGIVCKPLGTIETVKLAYKGGKLLRDLLILLGP